MPWPYIDSEKALPWIEQKTGLSLPENQVAAIRLALLSKVLVITGGPGVGKTTIVNSILRILAAKGVSLLLCAPTGRAAKRMTEATGLEAKTIHRLLEPRVGQRRQWGRCRRSTADGVDGRGGSRARSLLTAGSLAAPSDPLKWPAPSTSITIFGSCAGSGALPQ